MGVPNLCPPKNLQEGLDLFYGYVNVVANEENITCA